MCPLLILDKNPLEGRFIAALGNRQYEVVVEASDAGTAGNLGLLVDHLNATMKCPAGRQQVFLQSFIEFGQEAEPRVCLRCPVRARLGLPHYVGYEHIRDICCRAPERCGADEQLPGGGAGVCRMQALERNESLPVGAAAQPR
jgi:hypothetical protein